MKNFVITVNGQEYEVGVQEVGGSAAPVAAAPAPKAAPAPAAAPAPKAAPAPAAAPKAAPAGSSTISAPMPGKILSINAKPGATVKRGDVLLILEAMKMANEIMAPADGKVADVRVSVGQTVSTGDPMVVLG